MNAKRETRDALLAATLDVVTEHGVAGTTSRRIAEAAGTNLQAITYHFGSKDDLVAEALTDAVRAWVAPARAALRDLAEDPAGHLLHAVGELEVALAAARPRLPAYLEALAAAPRRAEFAVRIRGMLAEFRGELASALTALRTAGHLPAWIDPQAMASLVLAAADGAAIHLALDPEAVDAEDLLSQVVPLLLSVASLAAPDDPDDPDPNDGG